MTLVTDYVSTPGPRADLEGVEHYHFDLGNGWLASVIRGVLPTEERAFGGNREEIRETEGYAEGKYEVMLFNPPDFMATLMGLGGVPVLHDAEYNTTIHDPEGDVCCAVVTGAELNALLARVSQRETVQ